MPKEPCPGCGKVHSESENILHQAFGAGYGLAGELFRVIQDGDEEAPGLLENVTTEEDAFLLRMAILNGALTFLAETYLYEGETPIQAIKDFAFALEQAENSMEEPEDLPESTPRQDPGMN